MERERGSAIMCVCVRACARAYEWDRERSADGYRREWEREGEREKTSARATRAQEDERRRHAACLRDSGKFFFFLLHASNALSSHFHIGYTRTRLHVRAPGQAPGKHQQSAFFFFFFSCSRAASVMTRLPTRCGMTIPRTLFVLVLSVHCAGIRFGEESTPSFLNPQRPIYSKPPRDW